MRIRSCTRVCVLYYNRICVYDYQVCLLCAETINIYIRECFYRIIINFNLFLS